MQGERLLQLTCRTVPCSVALEALLRIPYQSPQVDRQIDAGFSARQYLPTQGHEVLPQLLHEHESVSDLVATANDSLCSAAHGAACVQTGTHLIFAFQKLVSIHIGS